MTQRYAELDYIKVFGIFAVILIHSLRPIWDSGASVSELFLNQELRFAVPGFLFCSGFLYARTRAFDWRVTGSRLQRILLPYFVASVAAEVYYAVRGHPRTVSEILFNLATGNSFGPFYYIFIIVILVIATPLFASASWRSILGLTLLICGYQTYLVVRPSLPGADDSNAQMYFWLFRSPILWWGYFLLGWLVRLRHEVIRRWIVRYRRKTASVLAIVCVAFATAQLTAVSRPIATITSWLQIFSILMLIATLSCGARRVPGSVKRISDATYAIYLFHLFFVLPVKAQFRGPPQVLDVIAVLAPFFAGIAGPLALIALARHFLGSRSRLVMGA